MDNAPIPFVILTSPRTGSTLLVHMLDSHPEVAAGGEFFNVDLVGRGVIDWPDPALRNDPELHALRAADPVAFLGRMRDEAARRGVRAAGFKLIYEQALETAPRGVIEYLVADRSIRVIHLRRRNVLRQYLSLKVAARTGEWHRKVGEKGGRPERGPLRLDFDEMVWFFRRVHNRWQTFERHFAEHALIHVDYEDLAAEPLETTNRIQDFLGLERRELSITHRKTGAESLQAAIENYDELKSVFAEWAGYFEE
jgi:LPS sulfotransferase NodH